MAPKAKATTTRSLRAIALQALWIHFTHALEAQKHKHKSSQVRPHDQKKCVRRSLSINSVAAISMQMCVTRSGAIIGWLDFVAVLVAADEKELCCVYRVVLL